MGMTEIVLGNKKCKLDNFLLQRLDNVKKILKKNWDCVILIDGMERSGKSTLGMTCGWYLSNGNFDYVNVASDSDDAVKKCTELPDGSVLMLDEGSLIFSSKDTMKSEQKKLVKIMNVIGQKNMVFIVILPCFFELNKFIAVSRSRFLLHVYTDKAMNRGRFTYFGEKKKRVLFDYGKKHYNSYKYPRATFIGSFRNFLPFDNMDEYKAIKKKSLQEALGSDIRTQVEKERLKIKKFVDNLTTLMKKKGVKITKEEAGRIFDTSARTLGRALDTPPILEVRQGAYSLINH